MDGVLSRWGSCLKKLAPSSRSSRVASAAAAPFAATGIAASDAAVARAPCAPTDGAGSPSLAGRLGSSCTPQPGQQELHIPSHAPQLSPLFEANEGPLSDGLACPRVQPRAAPMPAQGADAEVEGAGNAKAAAAAVVAARVAAAAGAVGAGAAAVAASKQETVLLGASDPAGEDKCRAAFEASVMAMGAYIQEAKAAEPPTSGLSTGWATPPNSLGRLAQLLHDRTREPFVPMQVSPSAMRPQALHAYGCMSVQEDMCLLSVASRATQASRGSKAQLRNRTEPGAVETGATDSSTAINALLLPAPPPPAMVGPTSEGGIAATSLPAAAAPTASVEAMLATTPSTKTATSCSLRRTATSLSDPQVTLCWDGEEVAAVQARGPSPGPGPGLGRNLYTERTHTPEAPEEGCAAAAAGPSLGPTAACLHELAEALGRRHGAPHQDAGLFCAGALPNAEHSESRGLVSAAGLAGRMHRKLVLPGSYTEGLRASTDPALGPKARHSEGLKRRPATLQL